MIKRVLYCPTNDRYFKGATDWSTPNFEWVTKLKNAARYSLSKNDNDAIDLVIETGRGMGLTFEVKQVKVIPASIELLS